MGVRNASAALRVVFFTVAPIGSIAESGVYTDLLREFCARGCEVTVIAPAESRYGISAGISHEDGIRIIRVETGGVTKVRSALRKGVATLFMEQRFITAIRQHLDGEHFDLVLYTAPPVNVDRIVAHFKAQGRCHSYLMLKDIFPQNAVDLGMMRQGGLVWRYFRYREARLYAASDTIGCMSEGNVRYICEHNPGIDPATVEVCPNSIRPMPAPVRHSGSMRTSLGIPKDVFLLVYGGNLGVPQGIGFLLQILDYCKDREDLYFVIAGSGTEFSRVENHLLRGGHKNVRLTQSLPRRDFTALLADADVGLVLLDGRFTIPNFPSRLTSYLEAGLPVISATDGNTDLPEVLAASGCGIGVEAGDLNGFMHALDSVVADPGGAREMGLSARQLLEDRYTVNHSYDIIIARVGRSSGDCRSESPRIRDAYSVRSMERADVDGVVATHLAAMPDFFLSSLGRGFLRPYYAALVADPSAIACVAADRNGVVVGFAVGSTNPSGFYSRLLSRRWLVFALASVPGLIRNPRAATRIVRAVRYPGSQPQGDDLGGLYSIGVRPEMQGHGIGRQLVTAFLEDARARGSSAVYLHADAEGNDSWNALLRRMGWRLDKTFATAEGRKMNEYWFVLEGE